MANRTTGKHQRARDLLEQGLKECSICREIKPLSDYYKQSSRPNGVKAACKACYAKSMGWEHMPRKQFPVAPDGFKYCTNCEALKPVDEFYTGSARSDNRTSRCATCLREKSETSRRAQGAKERTLRQIENGLLLCTKCGEKKPATLEYFDSHQRTTSGFHTWCKKCMREFQNTPEQKERRSAYAREYNQQSEVKEAHRLQQRKYYSLNPQRAIAATMKHYHSNPEYRERRRIRKNQRYQQDPVYRQAAIERSAKRQSDPAKRDAIRSYRRAYFERKRTEPVFREYMRIKAHERNARKRSFPNTFTVAQYRRMLNYWNGCCVYCGNQEGFLPHQKMCADHFIPLNSPDCPGSVATNFVPACMECNSSKQDRSVQDWAERKFGKQKAKKILTRIETYFKWVRQQDQ